MVRFFSGEIPSHLCGRCSGNYSSCIDMTGKTVTIVCCARCRGYAEIPELDYATRVKLGSVARTKAISEVVHILHRDSSIPLSDAKFIALHTTRSKGVCHRCYAPLSSDGHSECPRCKALNLDW